MTTNNRTARRLAAVLPEITVADVEMLRARALVAGNTEIVTRCDHAVAGQQDAWWLVRGQLAQHPRERWMAA